MRVILTVVRYPKWLSWAGVQSMALFHLPLVFNKQVSFYKLMGSGKNGSFSVSPDWQQWAVLIALKTDSENLANEVTSYYGRFITRWWKFFKVTSWSVVMEAMEGHGKWDGKEPFGTLQRNVPFEGAVAVLTRATIRPGKAKHFWSNVQAVANEMSAAPGFMYSIGIGEVPWIKQATFSIWQSKEQMKQFAYTMQNHKTVIQRTRKENWYSEDMFVRFKILKIEGNVPEGLQRLAQTVN